MVPTDTLRSEILKRQEKGTNTIPLLQELERRNQVDLSSSYTEANLRAELVSKVEDPKVLEGLSNEDLYAGTQLSLERREGSVSLIAEMEKRRGAPLGGETQPLLPSRNEFLRETTRTAATRPLPKREQRIVDDLLKDEEVKVGFPLAEGDSRSFDEILDLNSMGARPSEVKPKPSRDPLGQAYSDFSQGKRAAQSPQMSVEEADAFIESILSRRSQKHQVLLHMIWSQMHQHMCQDLRKLLSAEEKVF